MSRLFLFTFMAVGLFTALTVIETVTDDEPFEVVAFAFDMFETALLALAVVAVSFVALETREMRRGRADLLNDLARAAVEGDKWRAAIGQLRDTSEATVRQQAAAIYRKAGLSSRAELSAFFLEDLLAPKVERSAQTSQSLKLIEGGD